MPRRKPRIGRPTVLTPDTEKRILTALKTGAPLTAACAAAGITYATLNLWQHRAANAQDLKDNGQPIPERELPFLVFIEKANRARAEGLERRLRKVEEIAEGGFVTKRTERTYQSKSGPVTEVEESYAAPDWKALAWVLERSHREFFGREQRVELTGANGGPVEVSHSEVDALAARIRAHVAGRLDAAAAGGGAAAAIGSGEPRTVEERSVRREVDSPVPVGPVIEVIEGEVVGADEGPVADRPGTLDTRRESA